MRAERGDRESASEGRELARGGLLLFGKESISFISDEECDSRTDLTESRQSKTNVCRRISRTGVSDQEYAGTFKGDKARERSTPYQPYEWWGAS